MYGLNFGTLIVCILLMKYTVEIIKVIVSKGRRVELDERNVELDELRAKRELSIEDQLRFIEVKTPPFQVHSKLDGLKFFLAAWSYIITLWTLAYIMLYFNINIRFSIAIFICIIFSICADQFLKLFNVNKNDLTVYFRGFK